MFRLRLTQPAMERRRRLSTSTQPSRPEDSHRRFWLRQASQRLGIRPVRPVGFCALPTVGANQVTVLIYPRSSISCPSVCPYRKAEPPTVFAVEGRGRGGRLGRGTPPRPDEGSPKFGSLRGFVRSRQDRLGPWAYKCATGEYIRILPRLAGTVVEA